VRVLDEALPSVKSESTKENKSLKVQYSNSIKEQARKVNGYKSSLSREKNDHYAIDIHQEHPTSDAHRAKPKKNLKKVKSKKQLNLIERAKKHNDKSVPRNHAEKSSHFDKDKSSHLDKDKSPINMKKSAPANGLKRIKSSTALLSMLKKHK
jgi:hypothetical protein